MGSSVSTTVTTTTSKYPPMAGQKTHGGLKCIKTRITSVCKETGGLVSAVCGIPNVLKNCAASITLTMASVTPSPATRAVLKMPVPIPARYFGTTLTSKSSMIAQGMPAPTPISSIGKANPSFGPPTPASPCHCKPAAATTQPIPDRTPAKSSE